ncbi:MAG TPA: L,D-transpeptidase family protein [Magnetovibrio sp.]
MRLSIDPAGSIFTQHQRWRCALGKGGIVLDKVEGDGATPAGDWFLGRVFYRPDRQKSPKTGLSIVAMNANMGWCDDPHHSDYNRLINLPHPARHEKMWRDDELYDVVVEILYNTDPIIAGKGSAIFMHVAKPDYSPTEGCIALCLSDLLDLLQMCNEGDAVHVPA